MTTLSVIIVNHNDRAHLLRVLQDVAGGFRVRDSEVIVVDNASNDGSLEAVRNQYPSVRLIALPENIGFARANNRAAEEASGRFFLFLNSDTRVPEGTAETLIALQQAHSEYGIVAPTIVFPDGSLQVSWGKDLNLLSELFMKGWAPRWHRWRSRRQTPGSRDVDWVSGACFLIRRRVFEELGGFDERFFLYVEDADLGRRVRGLGYRVHVTSRAKVVHHRGQSVSRYSHRFLKEAKKSQLLYYCKHNTRAALWGLRMYLLVRFRIKKVLCWMRGDGTRREIFGEVIQTIREFSCEDPA